MKSHEIKLLECTSGLGSTGTNRWGLLEPRMDTRGSHLIPNSCWADRACNWECPILALAPVRAGTHLKKQKNIAVTFRGSRPCSKCILAYLAGKGTCHAAECFQSELFSANRQDLHLHLQQTFTRTHHVVLGDFYLKHLKRCQVTFVLQKTK